MSVGPLPQWNIIGTHSDRVYEATDPHGVVWRLWLVEQPADGDELPPGYRLAPHGTQATPLFITRKHGLYRALDEAGMRIASADVLSDPEGAARQMGLTDTTSRADNARGQTSPSKGDQVT
ncbi:hypothetical protein ABZ802_31155 [Streptomyces sp. NPDC047737]|uniref:hypothetical protein n=1 Tax=Streptomyces sp. NPDC047737 TaxID=3155740 RepID=UPI0034002271